MKFLLDENVSYRVASHMKAAGHDAVHVSEIGLTSAEGALLHDINHHAFLPGIS